MKFFIYKIYAIAKTQEKTSGVLIPFLAYISLFEGIHIGLIIAFLEQFVIKGKIFDNSNPIPSYSGWIFVLVGLVLNYFIFIKTKWVYQVYDEYVQKGIKLWKSNLLFFLYIIFLLVVMFSLSK
jgi:hypothetical protein